MSCEICRAALETLVEERVASVNQAINPPCECEKFSTSQYSPGLVRDEEVLHFLVPSPDGLTGGYVNTAFAMNVDSHGFSVIRDAAADDEIVEAIKLVRNNWEKKGRVLEGVISFPAGRIRSAVEPRLCCIYDTGEPGRPHHAELMATELLDRTLTNSQRKNAKRERLKLIIDLIGNQFTPAATFRAGKFVGQSPSP
jgi:hypothetical protein